MTHTSAVTRNSSIIHTKPTTRTLVLECLLSLSQHTTSSLRRLNVSVALIYAFISLPFPYLSEAKLTHWHFRGGLRTNGASRYLRRRVYLLSVDVDYSSIIAANTSQAITHAVCTVRAYPVVHRSLFQQWNTAEQNHALIRIAFRPNCCWQRPECVRNNRFGSACAMNHSFDSVRLECWLTCWMCQLLQIHFRIVFDIIHRLESLWKPLLSVQCHCLHHHVVNFIHFIFARV